MVWLFVYLLINLLLRSSFCYLHYMLNGMMEADKWTKTREVLADLQLNLHHFFTLLLLLDCSLLFVPFYWLNGWNRLFNRILAITLPVVEHSAAIDQAQQLVEIVMKMMMIKMTMIMIIIKILMMKKMLLIMMKVILIMMMMKIMMLKMTPIMKIIKSLYLWRWYWYWWW